MHRQLLASVATVTLTFGLVACGDGGNGPAATPSPDIGVDAPSDGGGGDPSDASGTTSSDDGGDPIAATPAIPAPDPADYPGIDQNTPDGAEQATRYFVALMFWGYQTGETTEFDVSYSESCETCSSNSDKIQALKKEGTYWSGAKIVENGLSSDGSIEDFDIAVGYGIDLSPHTEPNPEGGAPLEVPLTHFAFGVGLNWKEDQWMIAGMNVEVQQPS